MRYAFSPIEKIEQLRRQRLTGKAIAAEVGVSPATDDASRVAFSSVMKDQRKESAIAFLTRFERVMTDNGSCYRSRAFAKACKQLSLKHIFTKPYTRKPTDRQIYGPLDLIPATEA